MSQELKVTFQPSGRTVFVLPGTLLLEAAGRAGIEAFELGSVLLAGAFGNFIRRSNARRIGLLPQIPCEYIHSIGNAASMGAKLALLGASERKRAVAAAQKTEPVDLSLDPEFQLEFGMAMMFPSDDINGCMGEEESVVVNGAECK